MSGTSDPVGKAQREVDDALAAGVHFLSPLQMTDVEVPGIELAIQMPVSPRVANHGGSLQGGLIATLIDLLAGRLAMLGVGAGEISATNVMNIHFLAPIIGGPARAEGRVLRRGRRSAVVYVQVRKLATDRLAAVSTVGFTIVPLPSN